MTTVARRLKVLVVRQNLNLYLLRLNRLDSFCRGANVEFFLLHVAHLAFLFHDDVEILLSFFEGRSKIILFLPVFNFLLLLELIQVRLCQRGKLRIVFVPVMAAESLHR